MERNNRTTKIINIAFLIAIEIVLTRFCSVNTTFIRLGFGFIPVAMTSIMYGPLWAGTAYAIGDVLGMMVFPTGGTYFPGWTLTAFLTGIVFGLVLHGKTVTWKRSIIASIIVVLVLNLGLDTYWLTLMYGQGYLALLPLRLLKCILTIPVQTILIPLVWNKIFKRIPQLQFNQKKADL